ncbi:MAG TPA: glucose-6-phosphate isomerase, partial [Thermodesulfobacteriota bacterium]|nr:glucose-6-phosphate isomerase [Thermodesulfobacteriota bacterium]
EAAAAVGPLADDLLVLGIGGSALGTRALLAALLPPFAWLRERGARGGRPRVFVADNIDPVTFAALLELLDPARTVVNVVSKSGETVETMAQWLVVREWLARGAGESGLRERVVVTTDPAKGPLRELARREGFRALAIPPTVGGRFSVLSAVGLFPAAVAGIDPVAVLAGASAMAARCAGGDPWRNPAAFLACALHAGDVRLGQRIVVLMPYADGLAPAAEWFAQLWAESLGKARRTDGRVAPVGQTPVRALGTTDQHSQLQLYMEGPADKVVIFVTVDRPATDVPIPVAYPDLPAAAYLGGRTLGQVLAAEARGTELALRRAGRPSAAIRLPALTPQAMGEFFFLWELAAAYAGGLYGVNAFDQPGVEAAKQYAYALLGRPGFEERRLEVEADRASPPRYRF